MVDLTLVTNTVEVKNRQLKESQYIEIWSKGCSFIVRRESSGEHTFNRVRITTTCLLLDHSLQTDDDREPSTSCTKIPIIVGGNPID